MNIDKWPQFRLGTNDGTDIDANALEGISPTTFSTALRFIETRRN